MNKQKANYKHNLIAIISIMTKTFVANCIFGILVAVIINYFFLWHFFLFLYFIQQTLDK